MHAQDFFIRRADTRDLAALGRLGAALLREHHEFDRQRFMAPSAHPDDDYAWFLGSQLDRDDAVVLVAERGGAVLGYVYAAIEPRSWKELRDECGYIHDVLVDEPGRRQGVATALMQAAFDWVKSRKAPRVVLWTAAGNAPAQRLFDELGFRRTMVEMTLEM
jgi:GNAT superfamily N-acetyltransferase